MQGPLKPTESESQKRGKALEVYFRKMLAGRFTPGSGNKSQKGDVVSEKILLEAKWRWSYSGEYGWTVPFERDWLDTIANHATDTRKVPVLGVSWGDESKAVIVPTSLFPELAASPVIVSTYNASFQLRLQDWTRDFQGAPVRILLLNERTARQDDWLMLSPEDFKLQLPEEYIKPTSKTPAKKTFRRKTPIKKCTTGILAGDE